MWKAWTDGERLKRWFGPKGATIVQADMDLRPGGVFLYSMRGAMGDKALWGKWTFMEIVPPEKLVVITSFSDATGGITRHPLAPDWPLQTLSTTTFAEKGGKTVLTLEWSAYQPTVSEQATFDAGHDSMRGGWGGTMDPSRRLLGESAIMMKREVLLTRDIAAPRELVFKAWIEPDQLARWWGPHHFTNPVCRVDVRPGGAIYIVMRGPDGTDYPMTGTFHEIVAPERLVFVCAAVDKDGKPMLESLTTVTFTEHAGKTRVTVHASATGLVPVAADMLKGMEAGWAQSLERLETLATAAHV